MHFFVMGRLGAPESHQNKADGDDLVVHIFSFEAAENKRFDSKAVVAA